jgi:hypothetical protein
MPVRTLFSAATGRRSSPAARLTGSTGCAAPRRAGRNPAERRPGGQPEVHRRAGQKRSDQCAPRSPAPGPSTGASSPSANKGLLWGPRGQGRPLSDRRSRTVHVCQDTVGSHVAVTGTASLPEPSKGIASARREDQCCSTALPNTIG